MWYRVKRQILFLNSLTPTVTTISVMSKQSKYNNMSENPNIQEEFWLDEAFVAALEERAAALEITVDYYMEEFM
jgi:hypothetical protein